MYLNLMNLYSATATFPCSSIEEACKRFGYCNHSILILVGDKKIVTVQVNDLTPLSVGHGGRSEIGASSYRSLLLLNHGPSGMLY